MLSEILRADFRGFTAFTTYQKMGLAAILLGVSLCLLLPLPDLPLPDINPGLALLHNPTLLLGLAILWLIFFLHFGRSMVTGATISFHVHVDRI